MSTRTPLTIGVTDVTMLEWPEFIELDRQGHTILAIPLPGDVMDVIFGPECHLMRPEMRQYVDVAVTTIKRRLAKPARRKKAARVQR